METGSWTLPILVATVLAATVTAARQCPPKLDNDIPKDCLPFDILGRTVHIAHEWNCEQFYKCDNGKRVLHDCAPMSGTKRLHFNPSLQVCDWPECAGCRSVELIPHPGDCTKYYEIVDGEKIPMDCPSGLHFSPTEQTCMEPSVAGCEQPCGPCMGIPNGQLVPDNDDCGKYYECKNGVAMPQQCPNGLHFSPSLLNCVAPEIAGCNFTEPYPGDCTKYYETINGVKTPRDCPSGLHFSPTEKTCTDPSIAGCEKPCGQCCDMPDGQLIPDKDDCSKYYVCSSGDAIPVQCPNGLHFSPSLLDCVAPEIAGCNFTEPYPGNCSKYYETINGVKTPRDCPNGLHFSPTEKTCMDPSTAGCEKPCGPCCDMPNGQLVPDKDDCSKFYVCSNGSAIPVQCPNGLHFSPTEKTCMDPSVAGCEKPCGPCCGMPDGQLVPDKDDCSKYYACSNGSAVPVQCPNGLHFSPTEQTCMDPSIAGCEKPCGPCCNMPNGQLVPDKDDCSKFYVCSNDSAIPVQCPNGLHFSPTEQTCMHPSIAGCEKPCGSCCDMPNGQLVPDKDDCSKFYVCSNGTAIPVQCPNGLHFSPTEKTCMDPSVAGCEKPCGPCCGMPDGQLVPDKDDCSKYYACNNGTAISVQCPNGLHFSPTEQTCMDPSIAGCEKPCGLCCNMPNGQLVPDKDDCSNFYVCSNGSPIPVQCPNGLHFSPTEQTCMDPSIAGCEKPCGPCCNMPNGQLVPDKDDCNKFYVCSNGSAITVQCPNGLHFSPTEQTCMDPSIAGCEKPCGPCCNMPNGQLVPDKDDCSKFYVCSNGSAIPVQCPNGLHFSPTEQTCMDPSIAGCEQPCGPCCDMPNGSTTAIDCECDKYLMCKDGDAILKECPGGLHYSPTFHGCVEPCIALCNYTVPDPADCTKYYEFHNGAKTSKTCPNGLHFSPTELICMAPSVAGCEWVGCSGDVDNGWKMPHKCECEKYFLCEDGDLVLKTCPAGLHFSEIHQDCVAPGIAGCVASMGDSSVTRDCSGPRITKFRMMHRNDRTPSRDLTARFFLEFARQNRKVSENRLTEKSNEDHVESQKFQ